MKLIKKFLVDLMLTNEIDNKDMNKSHQVIVRGKMFAEQISDD